MPAAAATDAALDDAFLAIADRTRRAILQRLSLGDARVTDLAQPFDISLNSVSKHIRMLEQGCMIERRRSGREHWLSLDQSGLGLASQWMGQQQQLWARRLSAIDRMLQLEDASAPQPSRNRS